MVTVTYPVLSLRNITIFPTNIVPLAVGRPRSVELIMNAANATTSEDEVVVLTQRDQGVADPGEGDLYKTGVVVKILKIVKIPSQEGGNSTLNVVVQGVRRVRLVSLDQTGKFDTGTFEDFPIGRDNSPEETARFLHLQGLADDITSTIPSVPKEASAVLNDMTDPETLCHFVAGNLEVSVNERQEILEQDKLIDMLTLISESLARQIESAKAAEKIQKSIAADTEKSQKEYYLRKQLETIKKELGEEEGLEGLINRVSALDLPLEVEAKCLKQIDRLQGMQKSSSEYSVTLNYVETLLDVPWNITSDDNMDLEEAQEILDADHHGLDKVKKRVVEYLAVRKLKDNMKGPILCLAGPPGVGKAQPLDAKVLTPEGWKVMGAMAVGSQVIGSDGLPHKVTGVFPQGAREVFRVTFSDGSSTECCKEHLWLTQTDLDRKANRAGEVKSLDEISKSLRYGTDQRKNHSIPQVAPVEFERKDLPLDPYVLGALLGDGTLLASGGVKFSNGDADVVERVRTNLPDDVSLLPEVGDNVDYRISTGAAAKRDARGWPVKNKMQEEIIALGLAGCKSDSKFVPASYLQGSVVQRRDILQGLMDTDGTVTPSGHHVSFSTTSPRLAEDVTFLVRSLGGTTRMTSKNGWYRDASGDRVDCKTCYRLTVTLPATVAPFWCSRKASKVVTKTKYAPKRFIVGIEPAGTKETQCIRVDAENHLYVTDDFIVTHNTSLGKSIARTLGRKFIRISLGGVHDESEIRGHRRTYVGAMPGRLAKAMIKAGTNNPVIMLDEIDKLGKDFRGDPQAAMLEVLDPEQNNTFADHYIELPLDLSNVLFLATANQLENISGPLRDRMEIIQVPSYTSSEKLEIAKKHLVPKQIDNHGISRENLGFEDEALTYVIDRYTREAGVRNLERRIAELCRSVAVTVANTEEEDRDTISVTCDPEYVSEQLGAERYTSEVAQRTSVAGVATGLAWTSVGGGVLFVESAKMPGSGKLKLTGQLGDVMKESASAAMTFLRSNADRYNLKREVFEEQDIHIHFPAGAIPKDGPSAGVTIFTSLLSTLTGVTVRKDVAMTGEITLRGTVLPVGGIKEKLTAAHRAGIKRVLIPALCEKDLRDLPDEVRNDLEILLITRAEEVPALALDGELPAIAVVDGEPDSKDEEIVH